MAQYKGKLLEELKKQKVFNWTTTKPTTLRFG